MPNKVAAGYLSSQATERALVFNQTNYGYVDSVAAGASANVRVYGAAGVGTQYSTVRGTEETVLPSATIINVPYDSDQFVGYDGAQYQVRPTLPQVLPDPVTPIGAVSVVGTGSPTLPTVTLVVSGGYIVGATWTGDNGLTAVPTFVVHDSTGTDAVIVGTGVSGGKLTGIQVVNAGDGHYSSSPTVAVTGGVTTGATGGGTSIGGNSGRLLNTPNTN